MPVTDPIADMLTVIRNGITAHKESVEVKKSKLNEAILKILKRENFISNHKSIDDKKQGMIRVYLKYAEDALPVLTGIKRISKPGLRVHIKQKEIKSIYGGIGIVLISTSQGVMLGKEAAEKNLGGEVLCHVW